MGEFLKFIDLCIEYIKKGDFTFLFNIVLIIIFFWLFKEFRNAKINLDKINADKIDRALEACGHVILQIKKYKSNLTDHSILLDELYKLYPFYTQELINLTNNINLKNIALDCMRLGESELDDIQKCLVIEVKRLKSLQYDDIAFKMPTDILDFITYFYHKSNLASLIKPLISSIITTVLLLLSLLFVLSYGAATGFMSRLYIIIISLSIVLYFLMCCSTADAVTRKKIKKDKFSIFLISIFFAIPFLTLLPINKVLASIVIIYIYIYTIIIFKKIIII